MEYKVRSCRKLQCLKACTVSMVSYSSLAVLEFQVRYRYLCLWRSELLPSKCITSILLVANPGGDRRHIRHTVALRSAYCCCSLSTKTLLRHSMTASILLPFSSPPFNLTMIMTVGSDVMDRAALTLDGTRNSPLAHDLIC